MSMPRRPEEPLQPPPGPVVRSGFHDAVDAGRALSASLDTLVRACRASTPSMPSIASRTLALWVLDPIPEVELVADKVLVNGKEVMVAGEPDGRWILLAFMAGLRRFRPEPEAGAEDLIRLATQLSDLRSDLASIRRLRDWLWSDGAEGFQVSMDFGFSEGLEAAVLDLHAHKEALALARTQAAMSLAADAVSMASRELDVAAVRDEFQLRLEQFTRAATSGRLSLDPQEMATARMDWEDPGFWLDAQLLLTIEYPHLKCTQPAQKMAIRAMQLIEAAEPKRALDFWNRLKSRDEPLAVELCQVMEQRGVGSVLARRVAQNPQFMAELAAQLSAAPTPVTQDLATELLEMCVKADGAFRCMGQLVQSIGLATFFAHIKLNNLSESATVALGKIIQALGAPRRLMQDLVEQCPPAGGIRLAHVMGADFRRRFAWVMPRLVLSSPVKEGLAYADILFQDVGYDWASEFGKVLASGGNEAPPTMIRALCGHIGRSPNGGDILAPMLRAPGVALEMRLAAVRGLREHGEAALSAAKWRVSDMMASPDVRQALQELKGQIKENGR